jgi:hypothetical protein
MRLIAQGLIAQVSVEPDPTALPGGGAIQSLVNGIGYYALIVVLGAFLAGMALMAFGSLSSNPRSSALGKATAMVSVLAAFGIGAAAVIINFFYNVGGNA